MEGFFEAVGWVAAVLLVVIGLLAGWIASLLAGGRHRGRYMAIGVVGALLMPAVLAALGVTLLAAGGLVAILIAAAVGALLVLLLARAIFD